MSHSGESPEIRPEFRAHLEWQIATALRREERFAVPVGGGMPRLRGALALLVALALGAVVAAASAGVQDARQRGALVEAARSEEALLRVRVDLARAAYENAQRRYDIGVASRETVQAAETELRATEAALARAALDIEEIQATSKAPRNDLQAPLVGRRDFVTERLSLELETARRALGVAEQALRQAKQRFDVGVSSRSALQQAEADVAQEHAHMQQLQATLDLRKRAVGGAIKLDEVAPALRRIELTTQRERAERDIALAQMRLDEVRRMAAAGQATELELMRAEVDLLERRVGLKRIHQELEKVNAIRR
jgi:outer membrane protein TolC